MGGAEASGAVAAGVSRAQGGFLGEELGQRNSPVRLAAVWVLEEGGCIERVVP